MEMDNPRAAYRKWLIEQTTRIPLHSTPWGYRYPETDHFRRPVLTEQEERDVVALIREGWRPLDIAVAYGFALRYYHYEDGSSNGCKNGYTMVRSNIYDIIPILEAKYPDA